MITLPDLKIRYPDPLFKSEYGETNEDAMSEFMAAMAVSELQLSI